MPYVFTPFQKRDTVPLSEIPSLPSEVLSESFAQTFEENPLELFNRYRERQSLETGVSTPRQGVRSVTRITADEAGKMTTEAGVPISYTTPTTKEAVELDIERKRTERKRQDIYARSKGGAGLATARLALSIGTTLSDPIAAAMNFVPVVSKTRYANWLSSAGRLGRVGVRAGVGAAEGLAGAAIYEPLLYAGKQAEHADYTMADSLLNLSLGIAIGSGLHTVGGTTADAYRSLRGIEDPYKRITPFQQAILNGGKRDAPTITSREIEAGGVRLDKTLDEIAQVGTAPAVRPLAKIDHVVGDLGDHKFTIRDGDRVIAEATAQESNGYLRIQRTDVDEAFRGTGSPDDPKLGVQMAAAMAKEAEARGLKLASDNSVSPPAVRVYEALERRGAIVTRNPNATINPATGALVTNDPRNPVFVVESIPERLNERVNAATTVANASRETRELGLRIASQQAVTGEDIDVSLYSADKTVAKPDADTTVERSAEADQQVTEIDDSLEALEEEATVERTLTEQQSKLLGLSDDALAASDAYIAKVERWAQAAELAQVCLVRGG